MFYKLQRQGRGPRVIKIGTSSRITRDAAPLQDGR